MQSRLSHFAVLALLAPGLLGAAEIRLDPRSPGLEVRGEVVIRSGVGHAESVHPLGATVEVPVPAVEATVSCRGEGLWCPTLPLRGEVVRLPVFATMAIEGRVVPRGIAGEITGGTVQALLDREGSRATLEYRAPVTVGKDGKLVFEAPRAVLDLRFAFPGAAPVYRWRIAPPSAEDGDGAVRLGEVTLQPGSSLSGWVRRHHDELPVAGAQVVAVPLPTGEAPGSPLHRWSATTEENGFFQVQGLPPGTYRVAVEAPGLVTQVVEGLQVDEASEALVGTVLLASPIRISAQVTPPVDPRGRPWTLVAIPLRPLAGETPVEEVLDGSGVGVAAPLRATGYLVQVRTVGGDTLLTEEREVQGDGWWILEVPVVQVEGTVRLGGEPVAASVVLETGAGDRVELEAGEDGELSGLMRRPDRPWLLAGVTWTEADEQRRRELELVPTLDNDVARIDIDLPAGSILGEVVDAEGRSQVGMRVVATPEEGAGRFAVVRGQTDRNGRFRLTGLESVRYLVQAGGNGNAASEVVPVDLSADLPIGEVRLVVWPTRSLEVLVTEAEAGVADASVALDGFGRIPVSLEGSTDLEGRVTFQVPESLHQAVVTVFAPARTLWSGCLPVDGERVVVGLPTSRGAQLVLTTTWRSDLPPATGGETWLLTGDGGYVAQGVLHHWGRRRNVAESHEADGPHMRTRRPVPALPAGNYAVTWSAAPEWEIAARACARAFPDLEWTDLPPSGEAELTQDLTEVQRQSLRALEEGGR